MPDNTYWCGRGELISPALLYKDIPLKPVQTDINQAQASY